MDLVVTTGDRLVVNHFLEHDSLSHVQLWGLLEDLGRVPLSEKAPIFNENPPLSADPKIRGPAAQSTASMGAARTTRTTPTSSTIC